MVFLFENVPLKYGQNLIIAESGNTKDEVFFSREGEPDESYIYIDPNPGFNVKNLFEADESVIPAFAEEALVPGELSPPLLRVINRASGKFEEAAVKELNWKLNPIIDISGKKPPSHRRPVPHHRLPH